MSKREEREMRERLAADRDRSRATYTPFSEKLGGEREMYGGRETARYNELLPLFSELSKTGGIQNADALRQGFESFQKTGGFDPAAMGTLNNFFNNLISTGGYRDTEKQGIRARANAAIPAVFNRLKEQIKTAGARQGGYSPGATAAMAKLGRGAAQESAITARDTELDLQDRIRAGMMGGASGLGQLQSALQSGKQYGLSGQGNLENLIRTGKLAGMGGLSDLRSSDLSQQNALAGQQLQAYGQLGNEIQGTYSPGVSLATRPGMFNNIMQGIGMGASIASPFFMGGLKPQFNAGDVQRSQ